MTTTNWGGKREGAGRKASPNGKTVVMRVPESKIEEVKRLINNHSLQEDNSVLKVKKLINKWELLITPDKAKQPRWENAARLLSELKGLNLD